MTIVLDKPEQIRMFQLLVWKHALSLEMKGLTRRGRSVYSIVKQQLGFKGSKQKVYDQLCEYIEEVSVVQTDAKSG